MKRDITRLERELSQVVHIYVNYKHFDAVIGRMQIQSDEMGKDIKEILNHVRSARTP